MSKYSDNVIIKLLKLLRSSRMGDTDSYKHSHFLQQPKKLTHLSAYIEARWNKKGHKEIMFFGLQMFLKEYMSVQITHEMINIAERFWTRHGEPFNRAGWERIVDVHNGYMPLSIQALPEGMVIPLLVPQVQLHNTDKELAWLTTLVETALLRAVWYPSTVATKSWRIKRKIRKFLEDTCDEPEEALLFKLHDFGARGASSMESASIGGCAHIVNFMGSDTGTGIIDAMIYYNESDEDMPAYSIPASEHGTITTWGEEGECAALKNLVVQFGGKYSAFAGVSDSYDLFRCVSEYWGKTLKTEIMDSGSTCVIRPDSGDPTVIPVEVVVKLGELFGYTVNKKGYKVLPKCVRVIQGDSVDEELIVIILQKLKDLGWSAENIAFGMGGALLQGVGRDDYGYAMKVNAEKFEGSDEWLPVQKRPKTDPMKASKAGRLAVYESFGIGGSTIIVCTEDKLPFGKTNLLKEVWNTGELLVNHDFESVRKRANSYR